LEGSPAAEQDAATPDFFVTGQSFIKEIEKVIMQRHDLLHKLDVLHQSDEIICEELHGGNRSDAARIKRRRMNVAAFHQAEHFPRQAAHLQSLAVKLAAERIERRHDVGDFAVAVYFGVRRGGSLRQVPNAGIRFLDHLLAKSTPTRLS
jgi:hypothetical protein